MLQQKVCHAFIAATFIVLAFARPTYARTFVTPTEKVPLSEWPFFTDDLNFSGLKTVITAQLDLFKSIDLNGTIQFGNKRYSLVRARDSLAEFLAIVEDYESCTPFEGTACIYWFNKKLRREFRLYRPHLVPGDPHYGEENPALFTGYYTPLMTVSKTRTGIFQHGIYTVPQTAALREMSRDQIDFHGALENKGLDLFYGSDLFDLYLMQVQGGGHLLVQDGNKTVSQYISYADQNGLPFRFIQTFMLEKKWIPDGSITAQRKFLEAHPELQEEVYSTCPAYVYYKLSKTPPTGSEGIPLTGNRSIATDDTYYPFKGILSFVSSTRPVDNPVNPSDDIRPFRSFSRFYLDQDTGGAIRGKARADLYFGEGDYAEYASDAEDQRGSIYFLMLKK